MGCVRVEAIEEEGRKGHGRAEPGLELVQRRLADDKHNKRIGCGVVEWSLRSSPCDNNIDRSCAGGELAMVW